VAKEIARRGIRSGLNSVSYQKTDLLMRNCLLQDKGGNNKAGRKKTAEGRRLSDYKIKNAPERNGEVKRNQVLAGERISKGLTLAGAAKKGVSRPY